MKKQYHPNWGGIRTPGPGKHFGIAPVTGHKTTNVRVPQPIIDQIDKYIEEHPDTTTRTAAIYRCWGLEYNPEKQGVDITPLELAALQAENVSLKQTINKLQIQLDKTLAQKTYNAALAQQDSPIAEAVISLTTRWRRKIIAGKLGRAGKALLEDLESLKRLCT